jgi:ketopantoate hydroxymethyltransferase
VARHARDVRRPDAALRQALRGGRRGDAVARYAHEVKSGEFPEERHTYAISAEELAAFEASLAR